MSEIIRKISKQTQSVREVIYENLKEEILSGQYEPNFPLRERELAERFGVSTTPLKEALRRLEQEGLVYTKARVGTFVSDNIMNSVEEVNWVRSALEGTAARLAALKITKDELVQLEETIQEMETYTKKKDREKLLLLNHRFHQLIKYSAKNNYISQQIDAVHSFDSYVRKKALTYIDEIDRGYQDHRQIFEKIKSHDLCGAEEAMRNHIRRTTSFIKEKINDERKGGLDKS